jgi:hypothetical protein
VLVGPARNGLGGYDNALARLPGVAAIAPIVGLPALPLGPGGRPVQATVAAPMDGRFGHTLEVPKLLAGRQPRPDRPGEVMVDQIAAQDLHLRVGSRLELGTATGADPSQIRRLSERVVGIMVTRGSVVPVTELDSIPVIITSHALYQRLRPRVAAFDGAYVKLRPGVTVSQFSSEAQALTRSYPATGGQIFVADEAAQAATVLAAARDNGTLAALGLTAGLIEVGVAAAAGAVLACAVAFAASPLMPIGPARLAEPHPGLNADVPVLTAGFAAIVILLLAQVAWPGLAAGVRALRRAPRRARPALADRRVAGQVQCPARTGPRTSRPSAAPWPRSAPRSSSPPAWSVTSARTAPPTTPASTPRPRCWPCSGSRSSPSSSWRRAGAAAAATSRS